MVSGIKWRIFWPLLVSAVLGVGWLARVDQQRRAAFERALTIQEARSRLDRGVLELTDRHLRTMRRVWSVMLEPTVERRVVILTGVSQHYRNEIERLTNETIVSADQITIPDPHPRLAQDRQKFVNQLQGIQLPAQRVAAALELLMDAVIDEDPDGLLTASQELARADGNMQVALQLLRNTARHMAGWQSRYSGSEDEPGWAWLWSLTAVWMLVAVWLLWRAVAPFSRLARGETISTKPRSREEKALRKRTDEAAAELEEVRSQLAERSRAQERASQAVRRNAQELALLSIYVENLVNSLRSAVVVTDAAGRVTSFNRRARELMQVDESAIDKPVHELPLYAALAARSGDVQADLERALQHNEVLARDALPFAGVRGEVLLDLRVVPYRDESGAARGLLWLADDVTEGVRTKNQLLAAEHLATVGRLSAQVAHEIRNPLSAIGLNAELLEELVTRLQDNSRDEATSLLAGIASEIERLSQVTEGYLELARMPRPECRASDLNQMVGDLLGMLGPQLQSHRIEVSLEPATPAPRVWVDPGQLRQAMLNIMRNSLEAMPEGGRIVITTAGDNDQATVTFADDGPGIDAKTRSRVFEPFYSTKPNGTGLGLSLTEQIIQEHGGTIELLDNSPKGTRVLIRLPTAELSGG